MVEMLDNLRVQVGDKHNRQQLVFGTIIVVTMKVRVHDYMQ